MKIYIYAIWFPTSKKYYIGQTQNLKSRMFTHLENKSLVGNALRKYNDWQISIFHARKTRDEINLLEIECIRNFNSVAPNGYNLTRGGEGGDYWKGKKLSEEHKKRISVSGMGNQNARGSKSILGQERSEETKVRLSKSHLGIKFSESRKIKMRGRKLSKISILKRERTRLRNSLNKLEGGD